ncbi:MAG TPA: hypothetical protein VHD83_13515 [Puia sp.]|nr:hypothetical protein [Puia sp.]
MMKCEAFTNAPKKTYMKVSNLKIAGIALVFLAAVIGVQAQTADEIIAKHIDAMGGKAKLESLKSLYMEGVTVMGNGTEVDLTAWKVKDKLYRQEINFGMGKVVVIATPTKGWFSNPRNGGTFTAMPDEALKALQTQMDPAGPFVDYAAKGNKVELQGTDTVSGGKKCYKLKVTFANGQEETYYIDAQTYYVDRESRKGGGMMGGGGGGRRDPNAMLNIDFSDYQKTADGYVFPNTIVTGGFGAKMSVEKLEVNKDVDVDKLSKAEN